MPDTETLNASDRVRLMKDGLVNCSEFLLTGTLGLFLIPVLLQGLGAQAYGLWIGAMSVGVMAQVFDLGLDYSVTREVAADTGSDRARSASFVRTAGNAGLLLAAAGAALIAALGLPLSRGLHLSAENQEVAPLIFSFAAIGYFADRLMAFATAALNGLRRFDVVNKIGISGAMLRAVGLLAILAAGGGLLQLAAWQAAITLAPALAALWTLGRIEPCYRFRLAAPRWRVLRPHLSTSVTAAGALAIGGFYWQMPQLLLGLVGGTAWIAQYHIAQKFPMAVMAITGRAGGALFPAASEHDRAQDLPRLREVLDTGTRWLAAMALPFCLVLAIIAPDLLQAWLGEAATPTVHVLRLTSGIVFLNALAEAPMDVLYARGLTRTFIAAFLGFTVLSLALVMMLLSRLGIAGAAWGMLLSMACGSLILVGAASRACGAPALRLLGATFKGLLLPSAACVLATLAILQPAPGTWPGVIAASLTGGAAYAAALYAWGGRAEERLFAEQLLSLPEILWFRKSS